MNVRTDRLELVRQLVASGRIQSQGQLVAELARHGMAVTQATVSRDLATLGVVRGARGGTPRYLLPDDIAERGDPDAPDRLRRLLADLPLAIDEAPPLLVLRTAPGAAHAIASALDLSFLPGVVGSVAGDDTIFVACRGRSSLRRLRDHLGSLRTGAPRSATIGTNP
ncbi:MAG TPA: arginine repressor [Candidatus Limnocylindria bacterium]|nr:arginine repressor [Candidatus Limnocylindria bacterium]